MPSRASMRAVVAAMLVSLATVGCATKSVSGTPLAAPGPPPSGASAPPPTGSSKAQLAFAASPITYSIGHTIDRHELYYCNGSTALTLGDVSFSIGFRVEQEARDKSKLLADNLKAWRARGIKPSRIQVDGVPGYWNESRVTKAENQGNPGTDRFYVAAKGSVTVTLDVFAPENVAMPEEARATADKLFRSVHFDESALTGKSTDQQAMPTVPFTFERPASLTGSGEVVLGSMYWAKYELGKEMVEVALTKRQDAASYYNSRVKSLKGTKATVFDVKKQGSTAQTVGKKIDKGVGTVPRHGGGAALMFFILKKGDTVVEIRSAGTNKPLTLPMKETVVSILTSMTFT